MYLSGSLDALLLGGALNDIWVYTLRGVFFLTAILLIVLVLLQEGKGGGLAAALGGQGAETFGVATGGVNKVTMALAGALLLSGVLHAVSWDQSVTAGIKSSGGGLTTAPGDDGGSDDGAGGGEESTGGEEDEKGK